MDKTPKSMFDKYKQGKSISQGKVKASKSIVKQTANARRKVK